MLYMLPRGQDTKRRRDGGGVIDDGGRNAPSRKLSIFSVDLGIYQ